jgi:hypothetical protein
MLDSHDFTPSQKRVERVGAARLIRDDDVADDLPIMR